MATHEDRSCDPVTRFKLLSSLADGVVVDKNIPPRRYFRSGLEMERMAAVYLDEGNRESAFTLYMKYIVLFVEKLPKHPHYKQADPVQVKKTLDKVKRIFPITEKLRAAIKKQYEDEYEEYKKQEQISKEKQIQADRELCKQQEEEERLRNFQTEMQRQHQQQQHQNENRTNQFNPTPIIAPTAPVLEEDYPTAPKINDIDNDEIKLPDVPDKFPDIPDEPPPPYSSSEQNTWAPDYERDTGATKSEFTYEDVKPSFTPTVDRSTKPATESSTYDRQISTPINGLRRIYFPQELVSKFLSIASINTRRNLETCGILTGKLAKNFFHITHLVIPKQTSTSDSCTTSNEEEMFDVQDKHDLVTLGWIHTHPSQTSFLSSVDLHTHYAYQMLMPEAIAIVCAPKYSQESVESARRLDLCNCAETETTEALPPPQQPRKQNTIPFGYPAVVFCWVGIYRLTTHHGMRFIGGCSTQGFHPHPKEPPLFEESEHVQVDSTMNIQVIDLR